MIDENIVQWVLIHDSTLIDALLKTKIVKFLGAEITVGNQSRIDFILLDVNAEVLIVELETGIDSESKYNHCRNQLLKLQRLLPKLKVELETRFDTVKFTAYRLVLLYCNELTPKEYRRKLQKLAVNYNFVLRSYMLSVIQRGYSQLLSKMRLNHGLPLGRPVALGVSSLHWLNKLISHYVEPPVNEFELEKLKAKFESATNFYVLKRLAEDFELVRQKDMKLVLTNYGRRFRDALYPLTALDYHNGNVSKLSTEQCRILLESLTNGNFTKCKLTIYHFLRLVRLTTEPDKIPRISTKLAPEELRYFNHIFESSYNERVLKELIIQASNYCCELGLIYRLPQASKDNNARFDDAILTPLGSRLLGYIELYLHLKREQYMIPLEGYSRYFTTTH